MNAADPVRRVAEQQPGASALVTDDAVVAFGELDDRVDRAAAGLQRLGLRPGDRVALVAGNVPVVPVALLGALRAGLAVVPVNAGATAPELAHILTDADARLAVTGVPALPRLTDAAALGAPLDRVVLVAGAAASPGAGAELPPRGVREPGGHADGDRQPEGGPVVLDWTGTLDRAGGPEPVPDDPGALALLQYTSGTTGRPRGAMLPHAALLANQEQMRATHLTLGQGDTVLCVLPLFHIYALNVALLYPLAQGARVLLVERFDARGTLEAAARHGVTVLVGAPPMFAAWSADGIADGLDLSRLRLAVSGAAALPVSVLERFRARTGVPVHEGYGLTETAPLLTTNALDAEPVPGSVGRPVPGVELRLVDEVGREVSAGDPGEVVVRGPNLFTGYWNDPAGTAEVLDREGWFHTGDVGYVDDGDLYLVDRKSDLVIVNGFNVYPREVEEALLRHPAVAEAAVVGLPSDASGEETHAWIVLHPDADATTDELRDHCRRWLARYKCPAEVHLVGSLPHLPSGKVKRRELRGA